MVEDKPTAALWRCPSPGGSEYILGPAVFFIQVRDGSARLLDLGGKFYAVSPVGSLMLRETLSHGVEAAAERISGLFRVSTVQIRTDLEVFLDELRRERLLQRRRWSQPATGSRSWLTQWTISRILCAINIGIPSLGGRAWALLALARLSLQLFGWPVTVEAWRRDVGRTRRSEPESGGRSILDAVDETVRRAAAAHILSISCKERSLCCWALLRAAGVPAAVNIGISLFPMKGHCWCEADTRTLADSAENCRRYVTVARYE